jgi:hypothetical protein
MHSEVTVKFSSEQQFRISSHTGESMSDDALRAWLDARYTEFECEPSNPVGKVLNVDRVLSVARAAGPTLFADPDWSRTFAKAATVVLHRPVVRIDLTEMTIGY